MTSFKARCFFYNLVQGNEGIPKWSSLINTHVYIALQCSRNIWNVPMESELYSSCEAKFAVYYSYIICGLTGLNIVCNFRPKRDYPQDINMRLNHAYDSI